MTLHVWTAPFKYRGTDRFDITRKSGGKDGLPFAPSWRILGPALNARHEAERLRTGASGQQLHLGDSEADLLLDEQARRRADDIEAGAWSEYVPKYMAEMRASEQLHPLAWDALCSRELVTLVCYCPVSERCHRRLLAELLRDAYGAVYEGERP